MRVRTRNVRDHLVLKKYLVDREKSVVRFYVNRIPAATQWLEDMLKNNDDRTTEVVRSSSSGDPNFFPRTTFNVTEFPIPSDPELCEL